MLQREQQQQSKCRRARAHFTFCKHDLPISWDILNIAHRSSHPCLALIGTIRIAKASGIRYVVVPLYTYNYFSVIASRPLFMLADKLWPEPPITSWRRLVLAGSPWKYRHQRFATLGTDTFLIVSPGVLFLIRPMPMSSHRSRLEGPTSSNHPFRTIPLTYTAKTSYPPREQRGVITVRSPVLLSQRRTTDWYGRRRWSTKTSSEALVRTSR